MCCLSDVMHVQDVTSRSNLSMHETEMKPYDVEIVCALILLLFHSLLLLIYSLSDYGPPDNLLLLTTITHIYCLTILLHYISSSTQLASVSANYTAHPELSPQVNQVLTLCLSCSRPEAQSSYCLTDAVGHMFNCYPLPCCTTLQVYKGKTITLCPSLELSESAPKPGLSLFGGVGNFRGLQWALEFMRKTLESMGNKCQACNSAGKCINESMWGLQDVTPLPLVTLNLCTLIPEIPFDTFWPSRNSFQQPQFLTYIWSTLHNRR